MLRMLPQAPYRESLVSVSESGSQKVEEAVVTLNLLRIVSTKSTISQKVSHIRLPPTPHLMNNNDRGGRYYSLSFIIFNYLFSQALDLHVDAHE